MATPFRCWLIALLAAAGSRGALAQGVDWICKEAASQRQGDAILVCGVGTGKSEAGARHAALKHAKREFDEICSASADCRDRDPVVTPLRNSCEQMETGRFRCYRALRYEFAGTASAPRERRPADLTRELMTPTAVESEPAPPVGPVPDSGLMAGLDLLRIGYPAFDSESVDVGIGATLRFRFLDFLGIEAGAGADLWPKRGPTAALTGASVTGIGIGYDLYGALPFYLRSGRSAYFLAPEVRYFFHAGNRKTALGVGLGWQDLPGARETGWGFRFVVSDLVGLDRAPHTSCFVAVTYLFGLL